MENQQKIKYLLSQIKEVSGKLNSADKELLRDELLAYLLFGTTTETSVSNHPSGDSFKGLTVAEKELIKKLAAQTEALYRASKQDDQPEF